NLSLHHLRQSTNQLWADRFPISCQHTHARLTLYRRAGNHIYFRIGHTEDFRATLAAFKQRVPSHARRWNPDTKEWRVSSVRNVSGMATTKVAEATSHCQPRFPTVATHRRRHLSLAF
ncbi:MAG: hypothetical protein KDE20_28975, partial [Caldilineaceae bacterium]|nr:hypothetical protein [Caldilineaceae bacterium]